MEKAKVTCGVIKTKTIQGCIAKTCVSAYDGMVVINQRILATQEAIDDGYYSNAKIIYKYKDRVLTENEIVFWNETFRAVMRIVLELSKN